MAQHDLVIRNGVIVDGTGRERFDGDIAIDDGLISAVGEVEGTGREEIDAAGDLVAPGWVDIHTHYDGQVTWDPEMAPSSWHGATTVVMGNCGVGFAPLRPGGEDFLVELMEAVEDIPGTALHEGIDWRWETFGQYLDALEEMPRTVDVAAQVPHAALRAYVLGKDAHVDEVTADQMQEMADITAEAIRQGAIGFSTSRTLLHSSKYGLIPGTNAMPDELIAIGRGVSDAGPSVFQYISDGLGSDPADRRWVRELAEMSGVTVTYSLAQSPRAPEAFIGALDEAMEMREEGLNVFPQVPSRPTGMLFGLQSSFHPFMAHPSYRPLWAMPLEERVATLRDPEFRATLLAEEPRTKSPGALHMATNWKGMFRLGQECDYEPAPETSVEATAAREGRDPQDVALEWLLEDDGKSLLFSPLGSYVEGDHEAIRTMLEHPASAVGLSDGGAHCGLICDASFPTYLLTHWVRDRSRGDRLPLEHVINKQTKVTADVYGLGDRGSLEVGKRADINVIDLEALHLHVPEMIFDLPAGGRRLIQPVDGYRRTIQSGEVTFIDGKPTGARPGKVIRGRRS
ncbi:N-acyl-D-amino-acid deacylase family protein [Actinospongicola halichondriae]|uniref:N-acyl-D-amino-acid deacylase family protein n=1 Tax=Actinospongicola halichondriae TaxID=3236844 RepID=UPI003D507D7F